MLPASCESTFCLLGGPAHKAQCANPSLCAICNLDAHPQLQGVPQRSEPEPEFVADPGRSETASVTESATEEESDDGVLANHSGAAESTIDVSVDDSETTEVATHTLLTTVFLVTVAPTTSSAMSALVVVLAALVYITQAAFAVKLVLNSYNTDKDTMQLFVLLGYLDVTAAHSNCTELVGNTSTVAECRMAKADALDEHMTTQLATSGIESTWIDVLPVCLTDEGLTNSSLNMTAGMLIVCATVLLGLVEQISGLYTVKSPKAVKFAMIMIVLHVILGYTLLVASRRRIATVANDFWAVIETSLTVFLVTEIDDLVLYCMKRHPLVHAAITSPLCLRKMTNMDDLDAKDVHPCTMELLLSKRERSRRKAEVLQLRRQHLSVDELASKAEHDYGIKTTDIETAMQAHPTDSVSAVMALVEKHMSFERCALGFQPMEWIRTSVALAPYAYFVEWMAWATTFAMIGDAILGLIRIGCNSGHGHSEVVEVVAIACNLTGNGLTLLVFTIYDVGRILRGGVHSTDVIKAASISKRHRRYNTACCSASTRQQTEQKQRKLALQLRGDNEGGMEERQHLLRPSQIAEEKEKTQQGAVLSSHAKKMARRTKTIVLQTGRALNEQRGKLAQAIVFYSVTWLFVIVWASTVWGLDTTPEEERRYLLPLGGVVIFVNFFVVPRVDWEKCCHSGGKTAPIADPESPNTGGAVAMLAAP